MNAWIGKFETASTRLQRAGWMLGLSLSCFMMVACERQAGAVIDTHHMTAGAMQFLAVRNAVKHYGGEVARGYWCQSNATKTAPLTTRETDPFWDSRPKILDRTGYRFFGVTGERPPGAGPPLFSEIRFVDARTAYSTAWLIVTFDACVTRTYFNVSNGAFFADSMLGLPIDFPETSGDSQPPFFESLEVHEGGGCFQVDARHVRDPRTFYYCTRDNGKTWTVESPQGTRVVASVEEIVADRERRAEGNKRIWCPTALGGRGAGTRKADCPAP